MIDFPADIKQIEKRIQGIDPEKYAATRNYTDGAVTYLSPYISRGVISTRKVFEHIMNLNLEWFKAEKLIQELAWRDYWQHIWIAKGDQINTDLKHKQSPVSNHGIPENVINANTGIEAVDNAIKGLYESGYMHNHMRMYVASICCNIAHSHWLTPAKWLYSHLLDGDMASNHLSWQWVAGAFSNKKYYANQGNINKFFHSKQKNTFLDVEYEEFSNMKIPDKLSHTVAYHPDTILPDAKQVILEKEKTTLIYNYYNLDPRWHEGESVQRVLLLEPSFFKENPVSRKCVDFILDLSRNIEDIAVFTGDYKELIKHVNKEKLIFKEHPTNRHYEGKQEHREWLSGIEGYFPSFFAFWKKCKKELKP
jgi:deoxyribodipyrimidine photo-lyase